MRTLKVNIETVRTLKVPLYFLIHHEHHMNQFVELLQLKMFDNSLCYSEGSANYHGVIVNSICQFDWAWAPRYLFKHYSGYINETVSRTD